MTGQDFFGLGRLSPQDRRFAEWQVEKIFKLREEYTFLATKIKRTNVLRPMEDLNPLVDKLVLVSDKLEYQYKVIFAWLCHLGEERVWAEMGYDLFR